MAIRALKKAVFGVCGLVTLAEALTVAIAFAAAPTVSAMGTGHDVGRTPSNSVDPQLEAIEYEGRFRPADAASRAERFAKGLDPRDDRNLQALILRGALLASAFDGDGAKQVAADIEKQATRSAGNVAMMALAEADFVRGSADYFGGSLAEADRALSKANANLPDSASPFIRIRFAAQLARVREQRGKFDEAVALNLQAIQLADALAPPWRQADLRSALGYELFSAGQVDRAERTILEAIQIATDAHDPLALCGALNSQGYVLGARGDHRGELAAMRLAVASAREAGAGREESQSLANLADFHLRHENYATALDVSREAVALTRLLKNTTAEAIALVNVGFSLIELRQRTEGNATVEAALALAKRSGASQMVLDIYEEWGGHLEHIGALEEAHAAYSQYRQLENDGSRSEQQRVILEQQERLESQKREGALQLLEREHRLREGFLFHRALSVKLWATGASLATIALFGVGLLYRRLRRLNARLGTANVQLKEYGERDPLTGLGNRRYFSETMSRTALGKTLNGTLLLIDVDHFKRINDDHGHAAGDEALVEISRRIKNGLREQDVFIRWGGEEFLVFAETSALDFTRADSLCERLLSAVGATPISLSTGPVRVTASIGYATFPLEGPGDLDVSWEGAVDVVDKLMYVAKQSGRNCAYGIRSCQAASLTDLAISTEAWLQASRDGKAGLRTLRGPELPVERAA